MACADDARPKAKATATGLIMICLLLRFFTRSGRTHRLRPARPNIGARTQPPEQAGNFYRPLWAFGARGAWRGTCEVMRRRSHPAASRILSFFLSEPHGINGRQRVRHTYPTVTLVLADPQATRRRSEG